MSRMSHCFALTLFAATGAAYADQQADSSSDEAIETIEVTGIRHAIQTAIEEKKNNGSIVEAITAEDIADTVHWIATRPAHVNVNTISLMPVQQAFAGLAIQRKTK